MKRILRYIRLCSLVTIILIAVLFSGCGSDKTIQKKVDCTMCNGSGSVKYYYGNDEDEYNMGICTNCNGKGFYYVDIPLNENDSSVVCGSCKKTVEELITKEDVTGENRTWCKDCWEEYEILTGG